MRIGCVYAQTPAWPKFEWLAQACERLGHSVRRVHSRTELPEADQECELLLFCHKSYPIRWPNLRHVAESHQSIWCYIWFDLVAAKAGVPIADQPLFTQFQNMFRACDVAFVKERGLLDEYRSLGVNAEYLDQGCPNDMPCVVSQEPKWDLLVWGQSGGAYRQRVRDVQCALEQGFKVAWAGGVVKGAECLPFVAAFDLPALASQARCVLSCGVRCDVEGYASDQMWMALGMGACVIRRSTPGLPSGPYLIYHSGEELCDCLNWARKNHDEAKELGQEARTWVMENHTIEHRMQELLESVRTVGALAIRQS